MTAIMRTITGLCLVLLSGVALAGYDAHITRRADWSDNAGPRISFLEWQNYVQSDPQVKADPLNTKNDFIVTLPGESFPLWFNPELGEVYTKDPSPKALKKMIAIATQLHARVQGDDGEFYPPKP
jgi:hypothetical protein